MSGSSVPHWDATILCSIIRAAEITIGVAYPLFSIVNHRMYSPVCAIEVMFCYHTLNIPIATNVSSRLPFPVPSLVSGPLAEL